MSKINILLFISTLIFATGCADLGQNLSSSNVVTEIRKVKVEEISREVEHPGYTISHEGEVLSTMLAAVTERTLYKHSYEFKIDGILHQTTIVLDEKNESDINIDDYIDIIVRLNANDRINLSSIADYQKEKEGRFKISNESGNTHQYYDKSAIYVGFYNELTKKTILERPCFVDTEFSYKNQDEGYIDQSIKVYKKGIDSLLMGDSAFSSEGCYFLNIRLKNNGWIDVKEVMSPYGYEGLGDLIWKLISIILWSLAACVVLVIFFAYAER